MRKEQAERRVALAALLLATVCSNTTPIFSKVLLAAQWTPVSLYFLTLLVMSVFLAVHEFIALERGERWGMDRRDVAGTLLTTLTGGVMAPLLFFSGLERVQASEAVLLTSMQPFFVVMFAVVFLKERFSASTLGGGMFLSVGVAFVMAQHVTQTGGVSSGAVLLVAGSMIGALTTIAHKKFVRHRHLDSIVLVRSVLSLCAVGIWLVVREPESFILLMEPQNVWLVLGLPLVGFLLPFFFYFRGLRSLTALEAGLIATTGPIIGVLFAAAFLGERIGSVHLISLAFVLLGIVFINVPLTKWRIVPSRMLELGPLRK